MKIVFGTTNEHKLEELRGIYSAWAAEKKVTANVEFILPADGFQVEEDGATFAENAYIKARAAALSTGEMALADDSGLCVEALDGAPGLYSARYAPTAGARIEKLLDAMNGVEDRRAKFVCAMALVDKHGELLFSCEGECCGTIGTQIVGTNGFGYDPIFVVDGAGCSMAELSEEEKNRISHRAHALRGVLEHCFA